MFRHETGFDLSQGNADALFNEVRDRIITLPQRHHDINKVIVYTGGSDAAMYASTDFYIIPKDHPRQTITLRTNIFHTLPVHYTHFLPIWSHHLGPEQLPFGFIPLLVANFKLSHRQDIPMQFHLGTNQSELPDAISVQAEGYFQTNKDLGHGMEQILLNMDQAGELANTWSDWLASQM